MSVEDIEARLVLLAIEVGHAIADRYTNAEDRRRLRAARRALDDAQAALLADEPAGPVPHPVSGAVITFSPKLDPIYRRAQTRMSCAHCGAAWWYTPGQVTRADEHRRPAGRVCRKGGGVAIVNAS